MKKIIIIFIIVFCLFTPTIFSQEIDKGKIYDFENAVVAICHSKPDIKNIKGTGFIVNPTGIVVTADHVITDKHGRVFDELFALRPNHPSFDSFRLTVVKRFREGVIGRDIAILKIVNDSDILNLPYLTVGEKPKMGDSILIVGFPLVFDKVYIWPLFRSGIVASTRYKTETGSSILILDLSSVSGYSGSPVISMETHKVVGIFIGYSKYNPQTDFSIATLLEKSDIDY